jgi:hypothetical protein
LGLAGKLPPAELPGPDTVHGTGYYLTMIFESDQ